METLQEYILGSKEKPGFKAGCEERRGEEGECTEGDGWLSFDSDSGNALRRALNLDESSVRVKNRW